MASVVIPKTLGSKALQASKEVSKSLRILKRVDPTSRYVLLFPGGDSAHVGMAFKILNCEPAEQVFERASEILKKDILKLCLDGPREELLGLTENRDVATFVTSHATLMKLSEEYPAVPPICKGAAGIGVGFLNTLVFSRAMSFENALDLTMQQGKAMDRAAKAVPSAKVKVRLAPATIKRRVCDAAREYCLKMGIPEEIAQCSVTKQSYAHVVEIAGHELAIKYLETEGLELFKFRYIERVRKIPHAFHTPLMKPVQDYISAYIEQKMRDDRSYLVDPETCSVYSSGVGHRLRSARSIKKDLIDYSVRPIKSEQLLHGLFARPPSVPQPNTYVLWSRQLLKELSHVNNRAWRSARLFS